MMQSCMEVVKVPFLSHLFMCIYLHAAAISSEAVTSGSAVVQQSLSHTQTALITTATTTPVTQVCFSSLPLEFLHVITFLLLRACLFAG